MECPTCRKHLVAYLDDELSERDLELVEKHLHWCSSCAAEIQSLSIADRMVSDSLDALDVRPEMWAGIEAAIRPKVPQVPPSGWRDSLASRLQSPLRRWAASFAVVALLALFGFLLPPRLWRPDAQLEGLRQQLNAMVQEMDRQDGVRHNVLPAPGNNEYDSNPFAPQHASLETNPFQSPESETSDVVVDTAGGVRAADFKMGESEMKETR